MSKTPNFSQLAETQWSTEQDWFGEEFDNDNVPSVQSPSNNLPSTNTTNTTNTNNTSVVNNKSIVLSGFDDVLNSLETNDIVDEKSIKTPDHLDATDNDPFTNDVHNSINNTSTNSYQDIFELVNSLGLVHIPDNFSLDNLNEEKLRVLAQETNKFRMEAIHEEYKKQISHDPYMLELLDYARQGQSFVDLPRMQEILTSEIDYANLNLEDVNTQKELVYQFLTDGLDPNNPRDARLLAAIPNQIEDLSKELKLKNEAINAQRYFLNIIEQERQNEYARIEYEKQQAALRYQQEQAEIDKWDRDFRQALESSKWSEDKKASIKTEAGYIALQDGRRMPLWQYKQEIIFNNPALFQQFLDFTSKFDINTNTFNAAVTQEPQQSSVMQILERINKKGQSFGKTQEATFNNSTNKPRMTVNNKKDEWGVDF